MRHACTLSMPTFSQLDRALDTRANQMKPQLALATLTKLIGMAMMAEGGEKSNKNVVDEDLVVKRNSTSAIWTYFGFRRDHIIQTQVLCKTCRAATSRGNTTNLHHHLQYNYKDLHGQFKTNISYY